MCRTVVTVDGPFGADYPVVFARPFGFARRTVALREDMR